VTVTGAGAYQFNMKVYIMNDGKTIKDALRKDVPAVEVDDMLETAMKSMADENLTAMMVKQGEEIVGILTISDVMYSLADGENPQQTKVTAFMTKCELISAAGVRSPCVQLDEDEDLLAAIKVMNEAGVNHVMVSGPDGRPAGMVSSLEIIRLLVS
jgi:predicted transcriptional regulator